MEHKKNNDVQNKVVDDLNKKIGDIESQTAPSQDFLTSGGGDSSLAVPPSAAILATSRKHDKSK